MITRIPYRVAVLFTCIISVSILITLALFQAIPGLAAIVTLDFNSLPVATGPAATNALNVCLCCPGGKL